MTEIKILMDDFLKNPSGDLNILGKLIKIFAIFIGIKIVTNVLDRIIDKTIKSRKVTNLYISDKRMNTLGLLLKKIVRYTLYFILAVVTLDMFGVNTTSILATAGIGGLAIGFGAQSLVKDFITGFFILLEDQFAVGDFVKIEDFEGVVEELGLRVTKLRDFSGELHIIPNSSIQIVTNKTRGAMRALVKIGISYEEDIDRVVKILDELCKDIKNTNESILEGPTILGITDLGEYDVSITIVAKTKPMEQWAVEREIRKRVKETFEKEKIQVPYPKRIIFGGKD